MVRQAEVKTEVPGTLLQQYATLASG